MKKKLGYSQILAVYTVEKNGIGRMLFCIPNGPKPVWEGVYRAVANGIELPKRKRGQKFIVRYTAVLEKEL